MFVCFGRKLNRFVILKCKQRLLTPCDFDLCVISSTPTLHKQQQHPSRSPSFRTWGESYWSSSIRVTNISTSQQQRVTAWAKNCNILLVTSEIIKLLKLKIQFLSRTHVVHRHTHTQYWSVWEVLNCIFIFSNWAVLRLVTAFMAALSSGPSVLTKHRLRDFIAVLFCSEVMCWQEEPSCLNTEGLKTKVARTEMCTLTWTINSSPP